jgi:peptide deformylase
MSILKIARLGHPMLRKPAPPINSDEIDTPAVQQLVDDMIRTMREYGGVGLTGPQVHQDLRLLITEAPDIGESGRRGRDREPVILFNPEISTIGTDIVEECERCLSMPGIRGVVPRAREIAVVGLDRRGHRVEIHADGVAARLFQHELDHLEGAMYLDRMRSLRSLTYVEDYADRTLVF